MWNINEIHEIKAIDKLKARNFKINSFYWWYQVKIKHDINCLHEILKIESSLSKCQNLNLSTFKRRKSLLPERPAFSKSILNFFLKTIFNNFQ